MTAWFIVGFLFVTCFVLYYTTRLAVWTLAMLVYLLIIYYSTLSVNSIVFGTFSILYVAVAVIFNIKFLRKILITKFIFAKAKGVMPKISETEQLALNAGDPWYEKEVFQGHPDFNLLHSLKKFELSEEEKEFLHNETNQLLSMVDDWHITHVEKDLPVEVWNFIREKGFLGLVIAKEYGGKGFSAAAHSEIVMKIATRSISVAVTVMVPNSLGPGELLYHYGTKEQKNHYLPRLAKGEEIPCFALTGPTAGSDATSIPDEGIVCMGEYNGAEVLGIKLRNIDKRYITLAPVATLVGLAFRLKDPDSLLKGVGKEGITCALLPHTHKGLEIGNRLLPLDQVFMNGTVRSKESFIPMDWVIGGQKLAGEGWRMLVECLSIGRSISLPACGTASGLMSVVTTSAYALVREQFKVDIGSFEGVEEKLAQMGGLTYMLNATRQFTVSAVDAGVRPSVASAIAKYHLTQNGRDIIIDAMDVHAGRGIIMGPNNYLARGYQGSPVGVTVEGANILTRNLMIFGQGAMRCHPYIRKEYESLMSSDGLNEFDNAMFGHIGYYGRNTVHALFNSLTCGRLARGYSSKFNSYYKQISRMSSYFAFVGDLSLVILGGELKRKERISARLGDVMSYLYMACSSLKYYEANGGRASDDIFVTWVMQHCLFSAQTALLETLDNFTSPILGRILKFILFPFCKPYKKPSDELEHKLSMSLLSNCQTREVFKSMCYVPDDYNDLIGRVEIAFKAALETNPIKHKIQKAVRKHQLPKDNISEIAAKALEIGIIDNMELDKLLLSLKLSNEVIQVDEFGPFELGPKNAHPTWK
jgi:acyl-CoA dehydrogenase